MMMISKPANIRMIAKAKNNQNLIISILDGLKIYSLINENYATFDYDMFSPFIFSTFSIFFLHLLFNNNGTTILNFDISILNNFINTYQQNSHPNLKNY